MILAWAGLVAAVVLLGALLASPVSGLVSSVTWPEDAPLNVHDNRARDPHLRHLARVLSRESTAEAQRAIADLAEGIVTSPSVTLFGRESDARARLGSTVESFLREPAGRDHDRFLRRLSDALDSIERL